MSKRRFVGRWCGVMILLLLAACAKATPTPTVAPLMPLLLSRSPVPSATPGVTPATSTPTPLSPTPSALPPTPTLPPPTPTLTPTPTPTLTPTPTPTPACAETQGRVETGVFFSAVISQERPYRVYVPPCYGAQERYPVLYMLHGYPFDDSHWDELGIDEAANAGIISGTLPPFVIAMPGADNEGTYTYTSGGPGSFEALFLDDFVPFIEANYGVANAAQGRAIGGMSRGGVWSLEIAFRHPGRFAAVGGHSVALNVNQAPPAYDPFYLATDPAIRSLRIYLDVGRDDWTYPSMDELHAVLTASGVAHEYYVREGHHADDYWAAHVAEYLLFYTEGW